MNFPGLVDPPPVPVAPFTFADLFAGIGGFRVALEGISGRCVLTCELDARARATYSANHTIDHPFPADIRDLAELPPCDLVTGGFPCQPYSMVGRGHKTRYGAVKGIEDPVKGTVFHDLARLIGGARPLAFILENVPGYLNLDDGRHHRITLGKLHGELGYSVTTGILDARYWVPQMRRRVFLVGVRDGDPFDFRDVVLPLPPHPILRDILDTEVDPRYFITSEMRAKVEARYRKSWGGTRGFAHKITLRGADDRHGTLVANYIPQDGQWIDGDPPRMLTPRECARLMGFDEPGHPPYALPETVATAYKQLGNAVVPPCVRALGRAVMAHVQKETP